MPNLNRYLYRIEPTRLAMLQDGPTEHEADVVSRHFDYLQRLTEQGVMILVGRTLTTDESSFGICIFEAASAEEAQRIVDGDPAVREGVMSAELFPSASPSSIPQKLTRNHKANPLSLAGRGLEPALSLSKGEGRTFHFTSTLGQLRTDAIAVTRAS
jgi:uncharacterized protein